MPNPMQHQPVNVGPPPPPLAIVLIFIPATGGTQIQWPPQIPLPAVREILASSLATIDNLVRSQNGGIVLPNGPLPLPPNGSAEP